MTTPNQTYKTASFQVGTNQLDEATALFESLACTSQHGDVVLDVGDLDEYESDTLTALPVWLDDITKAANKEKCLAVHLHL